MSEPLRPDEIVRYLEKDLSAKDTEALQQRLATDPEAQRQLKKERELFAALHAHSPQLDQIDIVAGVHRRLQAAPANRRIPWVSGVAVALAATALFALVPRRTPSDDQTELTARSGGLTSAGQWMGIQAWTPGPHGMVPLGPSISADTELLFSYTNLGPAPAAYLMIFAVDADGVVRWYYPGWDDPKEPTMATKIRSGVARVVLEEAVRHTLPRGPMRIRALFLSSARSVLEIEAALGTPGFDLETLHTQVIDVVVQ